MRKPNTRTILRWRVRLRGTITRDIKEDEVTAADEQTVREVVEVIHPTYEITEITCLDNPAPKAHP